MRITFGKDYFAARENRQVPVVMDTSRLINGHVLIVGSSGVGKSYTIRRMVSQAVAEGPKVRFHVFDVHGDLELPDASTVVFSEQAEYGLNPLKINPDRHFGGVRKAIQTFIRTINQASVTALGVKQEAVVRNLLLDVFRDFGFLPDNPSTWAVNGYEATLVSGGADNRLYLEVPFADKEKVKALGGRWDPAKNLWWIHTEGYRGDVTRWRPAYKSRKYPTVADVAAYAKRVHQERFLGTDQRAIMALSLLNKRAQAYQRKMLESVKLQRYHGDLKAGEDESLEAAREDAIEAFKAYAESIQTGLELDSLLKYDSADVLKSVMDRLNNLEATGIFKDVEPPFDPSFPVWRYKLNALSAEEKKMMVLFLLQDIFTKSVQRGQQDDVVEVVVLDELSTYTSTADSDNGDGIIGVVAREARKFGLALWAANQTPSNVPESLITAVAVKLILGIDEMYWNSAVTKLRIETKLLDWIRPHSSMAVQLKQKGELKNRWWWVSL